MIMTKMSKAITILLAGALLLCAAPAVALDSATRGVLKRVSAELKNPVSVQFDAHKRLNVRWQKGSFAAGELQARSVSLLAGLRGILWSSRDFRVLETRVESSRFGSVAFSTIQLDGFPVIDQYLKVSTASDGSLRTVELSIPADCSGLRVADAKPAITLQAAAATICEHAARHHNGLICADQAQRVWYMAEDGTLAPGARMLLKAAEMSRLFEAVVDLRTGRLVRFADIARR